mmetsp:Transcript_39497/g.100925  ORF Transcript_39497/g.100925 Transcript_39497/m.100925 type:complete len:91 (+) Transcript_39497:278-550(+)
MTTLESILYARAGNEVYQRGAMRDAAEKESLMIYEQQAEEMEASGECKKYQNTVRLPRIPSGGISILVFWYFPASSDAQIPKYKKYSVIA